MTDAQILELRYQALLAFSERIEAATSVRDVISRAANMHEIVEMIADQIDAAATAKIRVISS